jgi:hypothetical protein
MISDQVTLTGGSQMSASSHRRAVLDLNWTPERSPALGKLQVRHSRRGL